MEKPAAGAPKPNPFPSRAKKRALAFRMSGMACRTPIPHSYNVAPPERLAPRKCSFISLAETVHLRRLRNNIECQGEGDRAVTGSVEGTLISLGTDPE